MVFFKNMSKNRFQSVGAKRPNHSLNRTLHSLPAFGLQKPSSNPVNLFRAG